MARAIEPAIRIRLSASVDAFIGRNGVHLLTGRTSFYLDSRAARKLADFWDEVEGEGFDEALRSFLAKLPAPTSPD